MNNTNPIHSKSRSNKSLTVSFSSSLTTLAPAINNTNSSNSTIPRNTTRSPLPIASYAPPHLNAINLAPPPDNGSNSSNSSTPRNTTRSLLPFASHAPTAYYYKGILRQHHTTSNPSTSAATRLQPPFNSANLLNFGSVMLFFLLTLLLLKRQDIQEDNNSLTKNTGFLLTQSQVEQLTKLQRQLDSLTDDINDFTNFDEDNSAKNTHDFLLERLDELNQTIQKLLALKTLTNNEEVNNTDLVAANTLQELEHDVDTVAHDINEHLGDLTRSTPAFR